MNYDDGRTIVMEPIRYESILNKDVKSEPNKIYIQSLILKMTMKKMMKKMMITSLNQKIIQKKVSAIIKLL